MAEQEPAESDALSRRFDVFLCHRSGDKAAVKRIGEQLRERGLRPWLDEWEIRPGTSWQQALECAIASIGSAAVFVGKGGIGPWQNEEIQAFLREFVNRHCPVIPVMLPGVGKEPELPLFLRTKHWVDFRKTAPDPLDQLVFGITGKRPVPRPPAPDPDDPALRPWEREYLQRRLTAWKAGRTAEGKTYLLDPQAGTELYRPDLYVPLAGVAPGWKLSKQGQLLRRAPAGKKKREREAEEPDAPAEAPLARWVSRADLRRLVLVGAPGGGKTVFLTRVAAQVALAALHQAKLCADQPADLEALDLPALARPRGGLPLPIVLEARRIAEAVAAGGSGGGVDALVAAIEAEVAAAGGERPAPSELRAGLRAGRYFLLVDAWDEIADPAARTRVLDVWRGMAASETDGRTRLVMTTRSARYTGGADFGDALATVAVSPLDHDTVALFCEKWTRSRSKDARYLEALRSAAFALAERAQAGEGDRALVGNPLLLTAICMVFERYRSLPEDRAQLCDLLVNDLCRSRWSEDRERGWRLDDAGKRNLLQEIALEMQQEGAQAWPVDRALQVALAGIPRAETLGGERAARHLQWAADHTGLLRFEQPGDGPEQVRFWHRLFREFLAASRLAQEDLTVHQLVDRLAAAGRLVDPFWEDVLRLLPRVLGTRGKAQALGERLEALAASATDPRRRGRLLGLVAAGVIESRDLFPAFDAPAKAQEFAALYARDGGAWPLRDRLFFLDGLARLDREGGDPRLRAERWVPIPAGEVTIAGERKSVRVAPFEIAWAPVTVQEYRGFVAAADRLDPRWWADAPEEERQTVADGSADRWRTQLAHPSRPVVKVSWWEAMAYGRWRTAQRSDGREVRLPTEAEWQWAAEGAERRVYPWGNAELGTGDAAQANWEGAGIDHPTPVGALPAGNCGPIVDLAGNVWEWCADAVTGDPDLRWIRGGAYWAEAGLLRCAVRFGGHHGYRGDVRGLRVVRSAGTV
ncbi:MAG: SUMF1/EgtB/PvdO family nonheme iron enzyme [Planctomycetes bacterium]|nr:SUMF1/EgtB/PvdO family nonheme iron enzyme [Planctomycetota bacterium]